MTADTSRLVVVHPDATVLAEATAARLLLHVLDVQSAQISAAPPVAASPGPSREAPPASPVHLVLTGGTVGIRTLAAAAASPLLGAVDWSGVHLWWGDERFLPDGDADRNETQAREALVDALVTSHGLPAENVHPMAGPSSAPTPEAAADAYAAELARFAGPEWAVPAFDVLLLGMGPDGHVASLFPGHDALGTRGAAVGVHGSPKPPPERVSLTFDAIRTAREVWVVAAGAEKAAQAAAAIAAGDVQDVPAAGAVGTGRTLWLLDAEAAKG